MYGFFLLAVLPFVFCEEVYIKPQAPIGRYEDMEPLTTTNFKVQELNRNPIYGLWQYRLYQDGDNTYIATSHFDNKETHLGDFPVLKWNDDDEVFEALDDLFPQVDGTERVRGYGTGTGALNSYWTDYLSLVYPFQTLDGTWWAYDSLGLVEDDRERYRGEVTWSGEGYLRAWDSESETWGEPAFTWDTEGNGFRHQYFVGADNREYLWTYTYGNDTRVRNYQQGVFQCWLLEYAPDSQTWSVVTYGSGTNDAFPACPKLPRTPVVFTSVNDEWLFLSTSQGTPTCSSGVSSCTTNKAAAPATWWTTNYNGGDSSSYRNFWNVTDSIDPFNIPALVEAKHWVYDGFDYIIALTETGVATYRLWWSTHEVEEMPFVPIGQPNVRFLDLFNVQDRSCFMVSSSYLPTYPVTPVPGAEDSWTNIYCWDPTHDNWDFAGAIPSEGTLWATVFTSDDTQYIVRVEEGHHQTKNIHVYKIYLEHDDEMDVYFDVYSPSHDVMYKRIDRNGDRIHKTLAVSITGLCIGLLVFVFVLLMLYISSSGGGGGGGSSDYRGM